MCPITVLTKNPCRQFKMSNLKKKILKRSLTCNAMRASILRRYSHNSFSNYIFSVTVLTEIPWRVFFSQNVEILQSGQFENERLQMADCRARRGDICDSEVLVDHIWGSFDLFIYLFFLHYFPLCSGTSVDTFKRKNYALRKYALFNEFFLYYATITFALLYSISAVLTTPGWAWSGVYSDFMLHGTN